jgi:hypothetical protein
MLMLLTFSIARIHQPADHFRMPETFRSVTRQISLDRTTCDSSERLSFEHRHFDVMLINNEDTADSRREFDSTPSIPIIRLLLRLKLGPSASDSSDPLF